MRKADPGLPMAFLQQAISYQGSACLFWPYARNSAGYGHINIHGKFTLAHRIVCEAHNGPPPDDKSEAAHACGNGHLGCITPAHLAWKTHQQNAVDMVVHGTSCRGHKHGQVRLTEDQVRFIRAHAPRLSNRQLADCFDVSIGVVYNVTQRITWKWVI